VSEGRTEELTKGTEMRVIVAGGGIAGLTAGAALRKAGAEVVVSEQAEEIRAAGASIGL
jgi:2-polyprenyl-6-methoxyphenol hydroxylase-like FAD-dependent oxidoreductase